MAFLSAGLAIAAENCSINVIVLNKKHLRRLKNEYIRYYQDDRTHLGLMKQTPTGREAEKRSSANRRVVAMPRLGGLHHRYDLAA